MSLVNPINKLAALLVYWWAKLLSSVTIEEYVSYRYLELGRSSYLEFISASSICNLELSMSFKQHTQQNRSCIFSFFVTLFCVWWVPHNVWWGPRAHQTFCLMEHQTFSPTLIMAGYQLWLLFEKIYFQGRGKLNFQSMSPNEFGEVPHTIGCKTPLGTVHSVLKAITIRWSHFQSMRYKPLKLCLICRCGLPSLVAIRQENQQLALCSPSGERGTTMGYQFW